MMASCSITRCGAALLTRLVKYRFEGPRRALHIGICQRFTTLFAKLAGRGSTEEVSSEATN